MNKVFLIVSASVLLVSQAHAGYQITMKSTTEADRQPRNANAQNANTTLRMTTANDKARIDFVEGQMPGVSDDGYLITKDSGKTFYMVSTKEKTYMKWDMESMMGMAGAVGNMMKMKVSDPKVEKLLDEAGQPILGYPTRHYKFRTSYHMSMAVMGFKNEMTINKEDETWTTTKLNIAAIGAWFNKAPKTQNAEMDKLIEASKGTMSGVPLKMLSVQTSTDSQGKTTISRTSMNVTEIKNVSDVSVDIPSDYKEIDLFGGANDQDASESKNPRSQHKASAPKFDFGNMMKKAMESVE